MVEEEFVLAGGRVLDAGGAFGEGDLAIGDGRILEHAGSRAKRIDARGMLVLPGIVDVHGDAFERDLMPRPGVDVAGPVALQAIDGALAANGITTAFHGLTVSWEPGLRGMGSAAAFMEALAATRPRLAVDHRVQLRWETFAMDAVPLVERWFATEPRPALAFNDHVTPIVPKLTVGQLPKLRLWAERAGVSSEDYIARVAAIWERRGEVEAGIRRMAALARDRGIVLLSHDERTREERAFYRDFGVAAVEFPMAEVVAREASGRGEDIILGAPNVMRGGSHNGALDATAAVLDGSCTVLASDYYYPSLLQAAARLAGRQGTDLASVWPLISTNAARAMRLGDRGRLAPGARADVVVLDWNGGENPAVRMTVAGGRIAYWRPWK
ncbi:MAG: alpha-D-ribose 1-methylphosphonate 5-triphosphate diphosphatase [Rhizobiales bacterium]|nr:alpha-D-ribose 1-methylphosphonate 5-triphosphate diphosphatase [Hyphomicrobiales bacterium]